MNPLYQSPAIKKLQEHELDCEGGLAKSGYWELQK